MKFFIISFNLAFFSLSAVAGNADPQTCARAIYLNKQFQVVDGTEIYQDSATTILANEKGAAIYNSSIDTNFKTKALLKLNIYSFISPNVFELTLDGKKASKDSGFTIYSPRSFASKKAGFFDSLTPRNTINVFPVDYSGYWNQNPRSATNMTPAVYSNVVKFGYLIDSRIRLLIQGSLPDHKFDILLGYRLSVPLEYENNPAALLRFKSAGVNILVRPRLSQEILAIGEDMIAACEGLIDPIGPGMMEFKSAAYGWMNNRAFSRSGEFEETVEKLGLTDLVRD